jgi:protein involved in temperature-dependent protein secretion
MTPDEVLATGDLESAIADVGARLRANPALAKEQVFLFELLVLAGRWDKARLRLDILNQVAPSNQAAYQFWRTAITAEEQRRRVFVGEAAPGLVGEPEPWLLPLVGAVVDEREGRVVEARSARARAAAEAPA